MMYPIPNMLIPAKAMLNWISDLYEMNPTIIQKMPKIANRVPHVFTCKGYASFARLPRGHLGCLSAHGLFGLLTLKTYDHFSKAEI